MVERYRYRGIFVYGSKGPDAGTKTTLAFVQSRAPKTSADMAKAFAELFDVSLSPSSLEVLTKDFDKNGGVKALKNEGQFANIVNQGLMLLMAAPETHFC